MTERDIAALRLASQQIGASGFSDTAALVAHMGAIQAQDMGQALWAVGLRVPGARAGAVRAAIAARTIVRSWTLRGTLHLMAAADLRWMLALVAERNIAAVAGRFDRLGLTRSLLAKAAGLVGSALAGGKTMARAELFALLNANGIATDANRGNQIVWRLAQDALLCCAGQQGAQPAFALLDEWLPGAAPALPRDEALARLARRYFVSHGPAATADLAWWAGLTLADARRAAAADGLVARDGLYMAAGAVPAAAGAVHLLPGFDEYLLGYKHRAAVLDADHAVRIVPGGNGIFRPMLVVDGRIAGTWQRDAAGVATMPFGPLKRGAAPAIAAAAARLEAFWAG